MQSFKFIPTVLTIATVALFTGCAASKDYTSRIFAPRTDMEKDSQTVALRFLDLDKLNGEESDWVTTDIVNGKDTTSESLALERLSQTFPSSADSIKNNRPSKTEPEPTPIMAKNANPGEVRTKKVRKM